METRINDFALANKVIEILCHRFSEEYINVPIVFSDGPVRHENGVFYLPDDSNLSQTMFAIVYLYLKNFLAGMPEEVKQNASRFVLAIIRDFDCRGLTRRFEACVPGESITMKLDQNAFVWMLLKNIVCPLKQIPLKNIRIIAGKSGKVDACRYLRQKDMRGTSLPDDIFPFIFANLYIESPAIRAAFLLVEATRAHLDGTALGEAEDVLRELFTNYFIKDKLVSFVKMVLTNEQEEADFFAVLSILCQSEELERLAVQEEREKSTVKEAQSMAGNWWFMGLTEKMLEPARSEDWTVYETWKPVTEELWRKVEHERRKQGLDEVPFEMLLRISSEDFKTDETKTLQALLADDRIW